MSGYQSRQSRLQAAGKSAVDSAALQEHLVQNLNLGDPFGRNKRRQRVPRQPKKDSNVVRRVSAVSRSKRPAGGAAASEKTAGAPTATTHVRSRLDRHLGVKRATSDTVSIIESNPVVSLRQRGFKPPRIEAGKLVDETYDLWQCEQCSKLNPPTKDKCRLCSAQRPTQFKTAEPVSLSLAQKRGLVPAPAKRMSETEWHDVERGAVARGMAEQDCPICMDALGLREHLVTSCGHLFHTACLLQFERFSRLPASARTCPVCRHPGYERKSSRVGVHPHRLAAVVALQAAWRGARTRQAVSQLRRRFYLSGKGDAPSRRRFFAEAVGRATAKLEIAVQRSQGRIDALMGELDRSAEEAREVMARALEMAHGRRARQVASIEREFGVRLAGGRESQNSAATSAMETATRAGNKGDPGSAIGAAMTRFGIELSASSLGLQVPSASGDGPASSLGGGSDYHRVPMGDPGEGRSSPACRQARVQAVDSDAEVAARAIHGLAADRGVAGSGSAGSASVTSETNGGAPSRRKPWKYTTSIEGVSAGAWTNALERCARRMAPDVGASASGTGREAKPSTEPSGDCPVCLVPLLDSLDQAAVPPGSLPAKTSSAGSATGAGKKSGVLAAESSSAAKSMVLLQCSHVFHKDCLASFARFCTGHGKAMSCPVCRAIKPAARAVDPVRLVAAYRDGAVMPAL